MVKHRTSRKEKLRRRKNRKAENGQARQSPKVFYASGLDELLSIADSQSDLGMPVRIIIPWMGADEFDAMLEGGG
jgi:hypothetical protein